MLENYRHKILSYNKYTYRIDIFRENLINTQKILLMEFYI